MDAIGFGALQQRHMPKAGGDPKQRPQQVAQHPVVGGDLLVVAPAFDQAGQLKQCRVNNMRHVPHRGGGSLAGGGIGQVQREMASGKSRWAAAGQRDHIRIRRGADLLQHGVSH